MREIIKFGASWCQSCKAYGPVFDKWVEGQTNIEVKSLDVEDNPDLSANYRVMSVPTTIYLVDDKETNRHIGPMSTSELDKFIK